MTASAAREPSSDQILDVARRLRREVALGVLMTSGADGEIHARVMQPFVADDSLTLWFGTSATSRKVAEVTGRGRATATFQSADGSAYASFSGPVTIVHDLDVLRRLWRPDWTQYFPGGPDQGYCLLELAPDRIEVLDFAHDVAPPPYGAKPATVVLGADGWATRADG